MKHILLTGGAGFIGHHVVEHILKEYPDYDIVIVDKLSYASSGFDRLKDIDVYDNNRDRVKIFVHDFTKSIVEGLSKEIGKPDIIIHMGAESHVDLSIVDPERFVVNNVIGTLRLLEFARLVEPELFVYFSTDEVYGRAAQGVFFKEGDRHNPGNPYSASKSAAEALCRSFSNSYGLRVNITNTMNCFTGDTIIPLLTGEKIKIKDLVGREKFWVYSYDIDNKKIVPGLAHSCRMTQKNAPLISVELDSGMVIKCTQDHLFLMRDETYKRADELKRNDSVMPLYKLCNHKIKNITFGGNEDVYDFVVDEYHNFALDSGVFVHNCFGERQHPEKFIPMVIRKVLAGEKVTIHSNAGRTKAGSRFYIHARNVAAKLMYVIEHSKENIDKDDASLGVFHIVGEKEVDNLELAQLIAKFVGKELKYEMVDFHSSRPGHDLRYAMSGEKLILLGYHQPKSFEDSLQKTVEWTLANHKWLDL